MHTSLTKFIANNKSNIPFGKKISILHDASQGLSFLHNHKPQILHRDLSPKTGLAEKHQNFPLSKFYATGYTVAKIDKSI